MTEWSVVLVIISLAGLIATVVKPIMSLTKSITRLTVVVERLKEDIDGVTEKNITAHARLWDHNEEQDRRINEHEKRIIRVETRDQQWDN